MDNYFKGTVEHIGFTLYGTTVIKVLENSKSFNCNVPKSYLLIGSEITYALNPKMDRGDLAGITVHSANLSKVVGQISKRASLSPAQTESMSEAYEACKNAREFKDTLEGEVSEKTLESLSRSLYGFNFLINITKNYFSHGMTYDMAEELFEKFGFNCFHIFEVDPYNCVGERLPFKVADSYYFSQVGFFGLKERFDKITDYMIKSIMQDGSTIISPASLGAAFYRAGVNPEDAQSMLVSLSKKAKADGLIVEELLPKLVIKERYREESELAGLIHSQRQTEFVPAAKIEEFKNLIKKEGINLTEGQANGLQAARFLGRTCCLTGGPGTGKTICLKTIIRLMRWFSPNIVIKTAAPTGKAAKRLSESSGEEATTIHRLLEPRRTKGESGQFYSFARNEKNKIEADVVIVDESYMMGTSLAVSLLKALKPETLLLLVGDVDQLPSVDAGQVFHDLIVSGKIPVYRLTKTMRQQDGSLLLKNINAFRDKRIEWEQGKDFQVFTVDKPSKAFNKAGYIAIEEYKKRGLFGFQLLVPQHHALCGTETLNKSLQRELNPNFQENNEKFFVGDKVILLKNHADRDNRRNYLNGDMGCIIKISTEGCTVRLVEGNEIEVPVEEYGNMDLAYAITVHKAQGSEYPSCVIACLHESVNMLTQNWVYTAISRAKELCTIVAEEGVFEKVGIGSTRRTCLAELL